MTGFGGLTITADAKIVSGQMAVLQGGPWEDYVEVWAAKLRARPMRRLRAPSSRAGPMAACRSKSTSFSENGGISDMLTDVDVESRVLVHGDLSQSDLVSDHD